MSTTPVLLDLSPLRISPAFRRIFVARAVSLIGIGMLMVSVPVQMWQLTGSSFQVGAATAVTGTTTFAGMLIGGAAADRMDRRTLILAGRSAAAASFLGLSLNAFGVFGGSPLVWMVYALAAVDGLLGALSSAALMAAVPTLIPRRRLAAVGALTSLTVRVGTAVSPGIAAAIIGAAGVEWAYAAATLLAAVTVVILLGLPELSPHAALADDAPPAGDVPVTDEAAGADDPRRGGVAPPGLAAFFRESPVVLSVMGVGVLTMLATGLVALLPALVSHRFGDQTGVVGYLMAATAAGALLATLTSGWIGHARRPGAILLSATTAGLALIVVVGVATALWVVVIVLVAIGFLDATAEVIRYTLIQQHTPGPLLGRVNGIWMAQEVSGVTVGSLIAGALGTLWAAPTAIAYYGLVLTALAVIAVLVMRSLWTARQPGC
ncbi:MFS transporter [Gordonia sp. (in: high G+C Gram-positive bacteria)]|uniref:MFS transporter n=1 Tax=Gordonia sp. (in: high G+C Gram-positive bacteria) TaxID=84139 RepID=UPI0026155147|nr:MFS transporter [Gordonia sp. (in: high G+C Gram-positive bacteria)]